MTRFSFKEELLLKRTGPATTSAPIQLSLSSRGPVWLQSGDAHHDGGKSWGFARDWTEERELQHDQSAGPGYRCTTDTARLDVLVEKVAASRISQTSNIAIALDDPELPPSSYSFQTLQTQTVDFSDSRQYVQNAATHESQQNTSNYSRQGQLLDVTLYQNTVRKKAEAQEDQVLILYVSGVYQNELGACRFILEGTSDANKPSAVALIPSAPKYTRDRSQSAFRDFSLYNSPGRVTVGSFGRAEEQEAERRGRRMNDDEEEGTSDNLISEHFIIHTFPSKICSVEFGPEAPPYGHVHTGPWVCIRTISSTVFATVGVSSRKERLQGYKRLRLVALLEIQHGSSLLLSGITQRKSRNGILPDEEATSRRSRYPIVDVHFHPHRCTSAVTTDSKGNVGVFDCDLVTVKESSWEKGVTWSLKQEQDQQEAELEMQWMIGWADEEGMVVLANKSEILALSLTDGSRKTIYSCLEGRIVTITRSDVPNSLLWVVTSKDLLLFDLRTEKSYQALLSWEHNCNHSDDISLTKVETINEAGAVLLSNRCNRLMSIYSAIVASSAGPASTIGEATQLHSGLPSGESYASAPCLVRLVDLNSSWHKWVRRSRFTSSRETEDDQLMIEMAKDGSVWIKVVSWSMRPSIPSATSTKASVKEAAQEEDYRKVQSTLPEITAQRSMHALGPVYRVLMSGMSADNLHGHGALSTIFKASQWLQQQDMALETMLLPHDLLALGADEDFTSSSHHSVLMQMPLLSMSMAISPGVQRLLQQLLTSMQSDAWTMDLTQLIEGQLCARVPKTESMEIISEKMARMYLSSVTTSRSLTFPIQILTNKMRNSSREIGWDLLLSSRVISMRPIVVQEANIDEGEDENVKNIPLQAPRYYFSFFTPRLAVPNESSKSSLAFHQSLPTRKRIMTKSARWLLDEWKIGSDPKEYRFHHPYEDDHLTEQDNAMTGSEDYRSQSESEQQRSSRDQSKSSRSVSAARMSEGQRDSPSALPLPPTIGSASQPALGIMPGHISHLHHRLAAQSQPVFAFTRIGKPKKRRVGGF